MNIRPLKLLYCCQSGHQDFTNIVTSFVASLGQRLATPANAGSLTVTRLVAAWREDADAYRDENGGHGRDRLWPPRFRNVGVGEVTSEGLASTERPSAAGERKYGAACSSGTGGGTLDEHRWRRA